MACRGGSIENPGVNRCGGWSPTAGVPPRLGRRCTMPPPGAPATKEPQRGGSDGNACTPAAAQRNGGAAATYDGPPAAAKDTEAPGCAEGHASGGAAATKEPAPKATW
mmetsp:Transcript_73128/g.185212  ORF Transcript_73128/g.185212 Transcript_73128/m.185212 type:complete len:108 (-) Transcript_73128:960-1283(-)